MASRLQDVLLRGTAAARPLATAVAPGTLYYATDTSTTSQSDGTAWSSYADAGATIRRQVTAVIDGGGAVITTGAKVPVSLPVAGTWKKWRVLSIDAAVTAGSIVLDVWVRAYASYPPTVAQTITASDKPMVSSANKAEGTALTGWTTAFSAGDVAIVNVDSVTTFTKIMLVLEFE